VDFISTAQQADDFPYNFWLHCSKMDEEQPIEV
jgi:hypothetical protein